MSILVVGSVAYDSVVTPAGSRDEALGGSATYFSVSGSFLTEVSVVAVIGDDFRLEDVNLFSSHNVETSGLERRPGRTFRWSGMYSTEDIDTRRTLDTQLNVFADFSPTLSQKHRRLPYLFLANIDPDLQLDVLNQMDPRPGLVALDTMNFWIEKKNDSLKCVARDIDVLFIDEGEARELSNEVNLIRAARHIMSLGPTTVIIKRGEHGALLFHGESIFATPAFPLEHVVDPTGAGDAFAGGFLGYLASTGEKSLDAFRRAAVVGSTMGSFAVESFSLHRLSSLTQTDIEARFRALTDMMHFSPLGDRETLPWRKDQ